MTNLKIPQSLIVQLNELNISVGLSKERNVIGISDGDDIVYIEEDSVDFLIEALQEVAPFIKEPEEEDEE